MLIYPNTSPFVPTLGSIPPRLRDRIQFIAWNKGETDPDTGHFEKIPVVVACFRRVGDKPSLSDPLASPEDSNVYWLLSSKGWNMPAYWRSLSSMLGIIRMTEHIAGLSLVLRRESNPPNRVLVAFDLDSHDGKRPLVQDAKIVDETARKFVERLKSYTEVTPSKRGLRIFVEAPNVPEGLNVANGMFGDLGVEVFVSNKSVTLTGWHIEGTPADVEARSIDSLLAEIKVRAKKRAPREGNRPLPLAVIREIHQKNLEDLREAGPGNREIMMNNAAYFAGRAFAGGALEGTEARILSDIEAEALGVGLPPEEVDRKLPRSWAEGIDEPLEILDPKKEAAESLAYIKEALDKGAVENREELLRHIARIDPKDLVFLRPQLTNILGLGVSDFNKLVKIERKEQSQRSEGKQDKLASDMIIPIPGEYEKCVIQAEKVLTDIGLKYFVNEGGLIRPAYAYDTVKIDGIDRDQMSVVIARASDEVIWRDLDRSGVFFKEGFDLDTNKPTYTPVYPPKDMSHHIRERATTIPHEMPFPRLELVVNAPVLLPSGIVHDQPGKLIEGVLFVPSGKTYPSIPVNPTRDDAIRALKEFEPLFHKFPFVDADEDGERLPWNKTPAYSVVLAAALTIAARSALRIAVPIFGFTAPNNREGKTKLFDTCALAITGCEATKVPYKDEEEFGKLLHPVILAGDRTVLVDNIAVPFQSTKLAPLITKNSMDDRPLGVSETVRLVNRSVFGATGVNLSFIGDLAVRALVCGIDSGMERPEARKFDFEPEELARERHPELVVAALTALRAYILAGKPWGLERAPWGGLQRWDELIGGCLVWCGYADPYETRKSVIEEDPERLRNAQVLQAWHREFGSKPIRLIDIEGMPTSETYKHLRVDGQWNSHGAGQQLRQLKGRIIDGFKLEATAGPGGGKKKHFWRVVRAEKNQPEPPGKDETVPF